MSTLRQCVSAALFALPLCFAATPAPAQAPAFKLRVIPELHEQRGGTPFAPADALTGFGHDRSREELEMRSGWNGASLVATAVSNAQQGARPKNDLVLNEIYYDASLFGERVGLGKKILSWDVGFGFRPLDVIQQENRRAIFTTTLEGVPYLAWERFSADAAWMLVIANPGRTRGVDAKHDESLALKYFRHSGSSDFHVVVRAGRRNGAEAGAALSAVVEEGFEWHASLLHQSRFERRVNPLTALPGTALAATDPGVDRIYSDGRKALLGATWTWDSGVSILGEAWYDGSAYSANEWRAIADLAARQRALLGTPRVPEAAVRGNIAFDARYFQRPNLLRENLLLHVSHRAEGSSVEPAFDVLYTPEDGGRVATASLGYEGNRYRVDAGLRAFGGRAGSAYRLLPDRFVGFVAIQVAF